MRDLLRALLDLVVPPVCAGCGANVEANRALCRLCDGALLRVPGDLRSPGPLTACVAAVAYEGDVERWIRRFKYPRPGFGGIDPAAGSVVRALACEAAARAPGDPPALVTAVPLHPRRIRERGYNPAALLAHAVAREHRLPWDPVALVRLRDTPSQTGLDRRARRRNVRRAFGARRRVPERVWVVDDVITTGSTLVEAARALRSAGAREVVGVCAAYTR